VATARRFNWPPRAKVTSFSARARKASRIPGATAEFHSSASRLWGNARSVPGGEIGAAAHLESDERNADRAHFKEAMRAAGGQLKRTRRARTSNAENC
jgi:hypothetical protein